MTSKRSLGLVLLALPYVQVAVGFIATGGSSGLLQYGYAWARRIVPMDAIVGWLFIAAAALMIGCAIARRWREHLAGLGYGIATVPVVVHMATCCVGAALGDLSLLEYQAALGSQIGIIVILLLLHDWPDPTPAPPTPPSREEPPA